MSLDPVAQRLSGEVTMHYRGRIARLDALELDAAALEISSVSDAGQPLGFERHGATLLVILRRAAYPNQARSLTVRYRAGAGKGLKFFADQIHAAYFTSEWMVCSDRPDDRATLRLAITAPAGWQVAASGERVDSGGEWKVDTPVAPFLYGFAAGRWRELVATPRLRILGNADTPATVAESTQAAIGFLEEKTGHVYTGVYTQVFAREAWGQEMARLALLPETYAADLTKDPGDLWLLVHELAHQWFAIGIPCRDWSDFWLNEGLATFLADAFLEQRDGRKRYQQEIERSHQIYLDLKNQGKDRALSFHEWSTESAAGGKIPYHKGAYVLDLLRREMGEEPFWRGLRAYTAANWAKPVTSEDFQTAMQAVSPKSLVKFFNEWVY